jgi:hypothetical protein
MLHLIDLIHYLLVLLLQKIHEVGPVLNLPTGALRGCLQRDTHTMVGHGSLNYIDFGVLTHA